MDKIDIAIDNTLLENILIKDDYIPKEFLIKVKFNNISKLLNSNISNDELNDLIVTLINNIYEAGYKKGSKVDIDNLIDISNKIKTESVLNNNRQIITLNDKNTNEVINDLYNILSINNELSMINTTSANTTSANTTSANTTSANTTSANTTSANTTSANTTSSNIYNKYIITTPLMESIAKKITPINKYSNSRKLNCKCNMINKKNLDCICYQ
jgi:hypothetical protein